MEVNMKMKIDNGMRNKTTIEEFRSAVSNSVELMRAGWNPRPRKGHLWVINKEDSK